MKHITTCCDMDIMRCLFCGGPLCWDSCEMAEDVSPEYDGDEDAVVYYYTCSRCGRTYEIFDPSIKEKETDYKDFWKNNSPLKNSNMIEDYFKELLVRVEDALTTLEHAKSELEKIKEEELTLFSKYPSVEKIINQNKKQD